VPGGRRRRLQVGGRPGKRGAIRPAGKPGALRPARPGDGDRALTQHLKPGNIDGASAFMKAFDTSVFER
jgi:hypothetical protein